MVKTTTKKKSAKAAAPKVEEKEGVSISELYNGKILVKFHEGSHRYYISEDGGNSWKPVTGVTTYIGIKDKSNALGVWQQQLTLDKLMQFIEQGVPIDADKAVEAVIQHEVARDEAADIGKEIHGWIEAFIRHELKQPGFEKMPEMPDFPEAITGVGAFMDWREAHKVKFISTETVVYSRKHGYVGTEDITFIADGMLCDADFKSSNGLYNSVRMQTAAYAKARMEMGGEKCEGRWAIRLSKFTEKEYYEREARKKEIKAMISRIKGTKPSNYPVKPYQVFEAAFLDNDRRALARDFDAFLNTMELTKWNKQTDTFITRGDSIEDTKYE